MGRMSRLNESSAALLLVSVAATNASIPNLVKEMCNGMAWVQAKTCFTTCEGSTPVMRASRPWKGKVSFWNKEQTDYHVRARSCGAFGMRWRLPHGFVSQLAQGAHAVKLAHGARTGLTPVSAAPETRYSVCPLFFVSCPLRNGATRSSPR
jgi:hypothetical protein